jgi:hypothetical protein
MNVIGRECNHTSVSGTENERDYDVFRTCCKRSPVRIVSNLYTYMYIQHKGRVYTHTRVRLDLAMSGRTITWMPGTGIITCRLIMGTGNPR